jgi:heme-degrading monooxygenase HmoA
MVIERALLPILPGHEVEFETRFGVAVASLKAAAGCGRVSLARGVESPSKYLLLIEWASLEDHRHFATTEEFRHFRDLIAKYFAGKPDTEHFVPVALPQ